VGAAYLFDELIFFESASEVEVVFVRGGGFLYESEDGDYLWDDGLECRWCDG
jgi:hypothetical protein